MLMNEKGYLLPRKQEPVRWIRPYEFSQEEIRIIKLLINIGYQHLKENKESCPWPEKAGDILTEIEGLNARIPFKVLLTADEYEALYALLTLALHLAQQPQYRSFVFLFDMDTKAGGNISTLLQKVIVNMERLRKQEFIGASN